MIKYCPLCASTLTLTDVEGAERLGCKSCNYIHWNNPTPVIAALVEHEGQYIIARNRAWPRPFFSLISGFIDEREPPEQALTREVKEELNLHTDHSQFLGHFMYGRENQLIIAYHVKTRGYIKLNHELAEYKRLSADEIKAYQFGPLQLAEFAVKKHFEHS